MANGLRGKRSTQGQRRGDTVGRGESDEKGENAKRRLGQGIDRRGWAKGRADRPFPWRKDRSQPKGADTKRAKKKGR